MMMESITIMFILEEDVAQQWIGCWLIQLMPLYY